MDVRSELLNGVLQVLIGRPPVNAYSIGLLNEVAALIEQAGENPAVGAILLRAEGAGFCGGGDVKEVATLKHFEGILGQAQSSQRAALAILDCPVPVICAVHGYCIGVGMLLAAAADLLIATPQTRFVLAEVDNGATAGGVWARRLMPEKRVRAAMMTADPVMAEELFGYGSIYRLVAGDVLAEEALRVASHVASKTPATMRRLKRSLRSSSGASELEAAYRTELSYTYELNMMGVASADRGAFIDGARKGYGADDAVPATSCHPPADVP
jgi:enoyl-CoA hydratase